MKQTTNNCLECQSLFISKRNDAKYCSNACRQQAHIKSRIEEWRTKGYVWDNLKRCYVKF